MTAVDLRRQHQRYGDTTAAYLRGENVTPGDCWRTAIACLLAVPRDDVPHFVHEHQGPEWWDETVAWVEQARPGWTLESYEPSFPAYIDPESSPQQVIGTGQSPRGDWLHSVIIDAMTGDLFHDPYEGGGGILAIEAMAALVTKRE